MKILVTGGAGFIGSHIVDLLLDKKNKVVIVDNLSTGRKEYLNKNAKFYRVDIRDAEKLTDVFKKELPELVIHTAAQVMLRYSMEQPLIDASINILGTINVLEACRISKVTKLVYTSTGGARVGEPIYLPVDLKHPLNPCSPYGISKQSAEHYVKMYSKLYGIDTRIFCFGNVYGPRDDPASKRVTSIFSHMILNNKSPTIFGDGNQTRDFIYVMDLAECIVNSINKKTKHDIFLLSNGQQTSVNYIFKRLKKISGFRGNANYIAAIKGEVKDIVLDTSIAKKELGWKPSHDIDSGLKETFEWMKNNRHLFKIN